MEKKIKHTYRHYVGLDFDGNGFYHTFKSFKVYWATKWYVSDRLDKIGMIDPTDRTATKRIFPKYHCRYTPKYKITTGENNWKYSINWYGKLLNFIRIKLKLKHRI